MKRIVSRGRIVSNNMKNESISLTRFSRGVLNGVAASGVFFSGTMSGPRRFSSDLASDWRAVGKDITGAMKKIEKETA